MEAVGSPVGAIQSGKSREQPLELSSVGCLHAIVIAFFAVGFCKSSAKQCVI